MTRQRHQPGRVGHFTAAGAANSLVGAALRVDAIEIWSDVDGDGWIDLLVTHDWGPVKLYRNVRGRLVDETAEAGLSGRLGWYNGIVAGDMVNTASRIQSAAPAGSTPTTS